MTTTLYRCRLPPDLFPYIVEGIPDGRHARSTLAALASTCHAFHGPAINALWMSQCNMINLLMTMPEDVVAVEPLQTPSEDEPCPEPESDDELNFTSSKPKDSAPALEVIFKRRPLPEDWHRFDYYASRVHAFTSNSFAEKNKSGAAVYMSYQVRVVLWERASSCPLLPNLRMFTWSLDTDQPRFSYQYFNVVGPKLVRFSISTKSENVMTSGTAGWVETTIDLVVQHAARVASSLVQLDFNFSWVGWESTMEHLPKHFPSMQNLRILTLAGSYTSSTAQDGILLSYPFLGKLPLLANLTKLAIAMPVPLDEDLISRSIALPTLKILELDDVDHRALGTIAGGINAPGLELVIIKHARCLHDWKSYSKLSAALCYEPPLLRHIRIDNPSHFDRPSLDVRGFKPLLDIDTLEEFVFLTQYHDTNITDENVLTMATSWPKLKRFILECKSSGITLVGLRGLVASCPNIWELCMMMELNPLLLTSGALTGGLANMHVKQLDLNLSSVKKTASEEDVIMLAAFLSAMFPNAIKLISRWKDEKTYVKNLVVAFQMGVRMAAKSKLAIGPSA